MKGALLIACCGLFLLIAPTLSQQSAPPSPSAPPPSVPPDTPPEPPATLDRALGLVDAGEPAAAIALLEPLRGREDADPRARALLGALYLESGRHDEALAVLAPLAQAEAADPAVLYNAARAAAALGRAADFEAFLERSARQAPRSPAGRELGLLRGRQGRMAEAYRLLRPWALANPGDIEAKRAAAMSAARLDRAGEARELLAGSDLSDPHGRLLDAQVLMLEGHPGAALAALTPILEAPPPEIARDVAGLAADAYLLTGSSAAAVELLRDKAHGDPRLSLTLAQALYQGGELEEALRVLAPVGEQALGAAGASAPRLGAAITLEQGRMLLAAGRTAEAERVLRRAVELAPESRQGWQSLGQALMAQGKREEGTEALERFGALASAESAAAAGGGTAEALEEALTALAEGDGGRALAALRPQLAATPNDLRLRLLETRALLALGRQDEALIAAQRALEGAPGNPDALYLRGAVRMMRRETAAAETDLRRVIELVPDHSGALNDLAVMLMVEGRRGEARALLERALASNPEDRLAAENLRRLDEREGGGPPPSP